MRSKFLVAMVQLFVALILVVGCAPATPDVVEEPTTEPVEEATPEEVEEATPEEAEEPAAGEPQYGGRVVLTTGDGPAGPAGSMDASGSTHDTRLRQLYMDPLMLIKQDASMEPRLAESIEQSDDGLVWTVKLQEDALWHDGEPVVADDMIFVINTISAGDTEPPARPYEYTDIVGYQEYRDGEADTMPGLRKVDDKTVEVETRRPNAAMRYRLAQLLLAPAHIWEDVAPEDLIQHPGWLDEPIGCGPFKMVNFEADQVLEFEAFEDYYLGRPYLDEVVVRIAPYDSALAALEADEVDLVTYLDVLDAERIETNPDVTVGITQMGRAWSLMFHFYQEELQDPLVGKALSMAMDRDAYNNAVLGGLGNTAVKNWYIPGTWPANPDIPPDEYNPEKARELLEEANFDFENTVMGIAIMPANEARAKIGEFFQANLKEIGVESKVIPIQESIITEQWWHQREEIWFTVLYMGGTMSTNPYLSWNTFPTDSEQNRGFVTLNYVDEETRGGRTPYEVTGWRYGSEELDALLEEALAIGDPEEAAPVFHKIDRYLYENPVATIVVGPPSIHAWDSSLQGRPPGDEYNLETWYKPEQWWLEQ